MLLTWNQVTGTGKEFRLKEISFSLEAGYLMVLSGANGAGKTTLLHYMLEEKKNYTGEILLDGCRIHENHKMTLNEIGYVSEENSFFTEHTAMENASVLMTTHIQEEIESQADFIGIMENGKMIQFGENREEGLEEQ